MGCCPTCCLKAITKITPEIISDYSGHVREGNESSRRDSRPKREGILSRVFEKISEFTGRDDGRFTSDRSHDSKNDSQKEENIFWNELVKRQRMEKESKFKKTKEEQKKINEANVELKRIEDEMRKVEEEQEKWVKEKLKTKLTTRILPNPINMVQSIRHFRFDKITPKTEGGITRLFRRKKDVEMTKFMEASYQVSSPFITYPRSSVQTLRLEGIASYKKNELQDVTASSLEGGVGESADSSTYYIGNCQVLNLIGRGCCGKVLLVVDQSTGIRFVMKVIRKLIRYSTLINAEKNIMELFAQTWHPFIVKIFSCHQTMGHIVFIMEYLEGRSLNVILSLEKYFSEQRTVFYSACVLLAIGYLHSLDVAHRDIKLENVVLDRYGYPKLIDFGMTVTNVKHNATIYDKSGTRLYQGPEFLIPGMITRRSSDFWSFGVIIHAMLTGKFITVLPVLVMDVDKLSRNAYDLLKKLFNTNPLERLGAGPYGGKDIMKHVFFKNTKWDDLLLRKTPAPQFKTKPVENLSIKNDMDSILKPKPHSIMGSIWEEIEWIDVVEVKHDQVIKENEQKNKAGYEP